MVKPKRFKNTQCPHGFGDAQGWVAGNYCKNHCTKYNNKSCGRWF